jgi:hypothetical protein
MAGAKQLVTLSFILVPVEAVRPAGVCSGHYIALHRGACRGGLQAWRERRPVLHVPEVLIEANANIVVKAESVQVSAVRRPPRGWGTCPPAASAALGEGAQAPTSQGGPTPCRSLPLLPLPMMSTPRSPGEKVPAAHASGTPHPAVPGALAAGSSAPSCASPALPPTAALRGGGGGLRAWAGQTV